MKTAWPEILRATLVGTAQGLLVAALAVAALKAPPPLFVAICCGVSILLFGAGLGTSLLEPGRSERAGFRRALAPFDFALLGIAAGFTLSVPLAVITFPPFAGVLALAAFSAGAAAYLLRCAALLWSARRRQPPAANVLAARWAFLVLVFPLPAWLLGWGGGSMEAYLAAFALQFAGLLAERWHNAMIDWAGDAAR
jgi:hypothetical protein